MFDSVLDMLDPYITEVLFGLILSAFGGIATRIFRTKASQDSLHSALETGVDLVTDAIAEAGSTAVGGVDKAISGTVIDEVVNYVGKSVPESVKYLKADMEQLQLMAKAKINRRLAEMGLLN